MTCSNVFSILFGAIAIIAAFIFAISSFQTTTSLSSNLTVNESKQLFNELKNHIGASNDSLQLDNKMDNLLPSLNNSLDISKTIENQRNVSDINEIPQFFNEPEVLVEKNIGKDLMNSLDANFITLNNISSVFSKVANNMISYVVNDDPVDAEKTTEIIEELLENISTLLNENKTTITCSIWENSTILQSMLADLSTISLKTNGKIRLAVTADYCPWKMQDRINNREIHKQANKAITRIQNAVKKCNTNNKASPTKYFKVPKTNFSHYINATTWETEEVFNSKFNIIIPIINCEESKPMNTCAQECMLKNQIQTKFTRIVNIIVRYSFFTSFNLYKHEIEWRLIKDSKHSAMSDVDKLVDEIIQDINVLGGNLSKEFEPFLYSLFKTISDVDKWMQGLFDACNSQNLLTGVMYRSDPMTYDPRIFMLEVLTKINNRIKDTNKSTANENNGDLKCSA